MTIDNKTAAEALRAIQDEEGRLTPDTVLRAAKNPRHPLHDVFEWNDAKAGHAWRVEQARALIARVRLEITESEVVKRIIAYVRDPEADADAQGYRATVLLADDKEQARAAVLAEIERVLMCLQRAADVPEAVNVQVEVRSLIDQTERLAANLRRPIARTPIARKARPASADASVSL